MGRTGLLLPILLAGCAAGRTSLGAPSIPYTVVPEGHVRVAWGAMSALLADNRAIGESHHAGYNGLVELRHNGGPSPFVARYAGLNLEHVNNGVAYPERELKFEPRTRPIELRRIDARTYELYQATLPNTGLESCSRFSFVEPNAVDLTFECIPRIEKFPHDHLNVFWASYIEAPEDKAIHFLGRDKGGSGDRWIRAVTPAHGVEATHRGADDRREYAHDPDFPLTLVFNESNYEYTRPFYYGRYRDHVLIFIFRAEDGVRLTQSPTGGGRKNPAWDFQWFIDKPVRDRLYRMRMRIVYKPWAGREDVLAEVARFR